MYQGDGEIDIHSLNTIRKTNQNLRPRDSLNNTETHFTNNRKDGDALNIFMM